MKRLLLICLVLISTFAQSQSNTLPTNGNVGIGTTSPTNRLQVNGAVRFDSTLVVKDSVTINKSLRVKDKMRVDHDVVLKKDLNIQQDLFVKGKSNFDSTVIFEGKVKMEALETPNTLNNKSFLLVNNNQVLQRVELDSIAPFLKNLVYGTDANLQLADLCKLNNYLDAPTWLNGSFKIFTPCPEVFVGVGTSTPRVNLDVNGTSYSTRMVLGAGNPANYFDLLRINSDMNPQSSNNIILVNGTQNFYLKLDPQGKLTTRNLSIDILDNSTPFIIKNTTQKLLQVDNDGLLHARRIKVDTDNWADFVFDKNYSLMPLSEVKTFVETNHHLPNIPSEKEVLENGIDISEMNKALLQKVEELTLYLIEQNEKIEQLEKKIIELKRYKL